MNISIHRLMKVDDLKLSISTMSLQEIYSSFTSIVDRIFYVDSPDNYWDILSRNNNKIDHEKILEFLSPNGPMFDLILKRLTTDKSVIYFEFSVNKLSSHTQNAIANNSVSMFINSKLYSKTHGLQNNMLFLNAFEYYMFSFISYIYHPEVQKRINWNGTTDNIYNQLLHRYFDFFFFNCKESSSLMQLALQFRSKTTLNQSFNRIPHSGFASLTFANSSGDLIFSKSRLNNKDSKNIDTIELYYTDTMIEIVTEFWLNNAIDPCYVMDTSAFARGVNSLPIYKPSVDQVCLVRMFVKHFYHFCYVKSLNSVNADCQMECEFIGKLNTYRQQIIPRLIVCKLLVYLQSLFRDWPTDLSFKIVMETWLSAIQPWRYIDTYQHNNVIEYNDNNNIISYNDNTNNYNSQMWSSFIMDNYELYYHILLQFLYRLQRMDLVVIRNAHMLYRVAKVLSQINIINNNNINNNNNKDSHNNNYSHRGGPQDLLFHDIRSQMLLVLTEIDNILMKLENNYDNISDQEHCNNNNWRNKLWHFLNTDILSSNNNDNKRVISYLRQSHSLLAQMFQIEHDQQNTSKISDRNDFLEHKNIEPEHIVTNNGVQLTDYGRFQVANKLCQLSDVKSNIDYYDRPVCSYEVAMLVKLFGKMSNMVCRRFDDQMRCSCYRGDFIGRMSRYILIGESMPPSVDMTSPATTISSMTSSPIISTMTSSSPIISTMTSSSPIKPTMSSSPIISTMTSSSPIKPTMTSSSPRRPTMTSSSPRRPTMTSSSPTIVANDNNLITTHIMHKDNQIKQWVDSHSLQLRLRFMATKMFLFWFTIFYLLMHTIFGTSAISLVIGGAILYFLIVMVSVLVIGYQ